MNKELINELKQLKGVKVIAVSKYHTKEEIDQVASLGLTTFGENKVQDLLAKYDPAYHWHMIGHLQTNKVKYIIGKVDLIQSLDSIKLAKEIQKQASKQNVIQNVLVQIKISDDENKTGLPLNELDDFLKEVSSYANIHIQGLMCVATHSDDAEQIKHEFQTMHETLEKYKAIYPNMTILSMGMSADYKLAIDNGSTMIRVGSAIFS